jgi:ABC-2 type transport system permease protein
MAQLDGSALPPWTAAQSRDQLAAIAWMRWRIFVHSFRYKGRKRSAGKWIVVILARILVWGVVAGLCVGPIAVCGFAGYYRPDRVGALLWAVFGVYLFISINISPATIGFDLTPLLRFPIDFRRYLLIRLFFGFFAIPTVVANLCLAAAAVGIGVARPGLFVWAALVLGIFALHNVLGVQLVFSGGSRGHRGERFGAFLHLLAPLRPVMQYLPPGLAASAIGDRAHLAIASSFASLSGLIVFALAFLAILAMRLKKEFRGENLSEAGKRAPRQVAKPRGTVSAVVQPAEAVAIRADSRPGAGFRLPSTIAACLQKELIYLKRSGAQLYGLFTPVILIFILARRNSPLGGSAMLLPYAVSYVMFGLLANLYNVLGADGPGYNLYLLAPIRLRDVLIAKNLVNSSVIAIEILVAVLAVSLISGGVPPAAMLAATLLWACFALFVNLTVGNLRSLLAPMRFELGKARRAPMAKGGAFISLGVLLGTLGTGIPVVLACRYYGHLWLATPIFLALNAVAVVAYLVVLGRVDGIASSHREELTEALCKS